MKGPAAGTGVPERKLEDLFRGDFEYFRSRLRFGGEEASDEIPASRLVRRAGALDELIGEFQATHPEGDRRAVVSLWFQWYTSALVVPGVATSLALGRHLPLSLEDAVMRVDDASGRAEGFRLPHAGRPAPDLDPFRRLGGLVWNHLDPLVDVLATRYGLSTRLLWGSVGQHVEWTVGVLERRGDPGGRASGARQLLHRKTWPGRPNNPLRDTVCHVEEDGESVRRRRVCCLRHLLAGTEGCGSLCPLPSVRASG